MPKIAIVAGETSGDIHAGNLVKAIKSLRPDIDFWGIGGERMRSAGVEVLLPSERISAMGLTEVFSKLPQIFAAKRLVAGKFAQNPPDLFIPVDFGGLNLNLAKAAKKFGVPTIYYIPPKVWAWGSWRAQKIKNLVSELLVILPFEKDFWDGQGVRATYVGSPVLDHLGQRSFGAQADTVGLLPGSRMGEIAKIWPLMLDVARLMDRNIRFLAPRAEGLPKDALYVPPDLAGRIEILDGRSQEVMERSSVCVVASGTATLECALVGTPMVSVYSMSAVTLFVARRMVSVDYFSLPNLVAGRRVVPELLDEPPKVVANEVQKLLAQGPQRLDQLAGFEEIRTKIGKPGAALNAAKLIVDRLEK